MRFAKKFELAWNTLVHSKLRSWLTIIGIVIGIAAVVAIVSSSNGAQESLTADLNSFGADQITVTPGFNKAASGSFRKSMETSSAVASDVDDLELTNRDIVSIESVDNVKLVAPKISSTEEVVYSTKQTDISITAINYEDWDTIVSSDIVEGRALISSDMYSVVIGGSVAENTFEGMQLNRQVTINDKTFRIVGILDSESRSVFIPLDSAIGVLEDKESGVYDSLTVVAENPDFVENTTADVEKKLMMSRGILKDSEKDFTVSNMLSMQQTITATLETLALFLGAIAAISLLVGGIGIANTMFTSVLEKTKEIGIMKAIGGTNFQVFLQFFFESGMLGFVGGLVGIILGTLASVTGTLAINSFIGAELSPSVDFFLIGGALLGSFVVGAVAGIVPAMNAAKQNPVEALRG